MIAVSEPDITLSSTAQRLRPYQGDCLIAVKTAWQRGERAWLWAAFVLIGNLAALLAYLITRSPQHPSEAARL